MKKNFDLKPNNLRVNQLGYLDKCKSGLLIVNYPKGVGYNYKNKTDIDGGINSHLVNGKIVKKLLSRFLCHLFFNQSLYKKFAKMFIGLNLIAKLNNFRYLNLLHNIPNASTPLIMEPL